MLRRLGPVTQLYQPSDEKKSCVLSQSWQPVRLSLGHLPVDGSKRTKEMFSRSKSSSTYLLMVIRLIGVCASCIISEMVPTGL